MKKKFITLLGASLCCMTFATACGEKSTTEEDADTLKSTKTEAVTEEENAEADESASNAQNDENTNDSEESDAATETSEDASSNTENATDIEEDESYEVVRVGSLKGPTTMGLVNLMKESEEGSCSGNYEFTMETQPDAILAKVVSGDLDIALVPANVASVLYNKTEGGVSLVDINTLGVLYCVTGDDTVKGMEDLAGKTVITTGQGASPEYVLNYLLEQYGVTDCNVEFKSEATEIAAILAEDPTKIAVLPQPFVTAATMKNSEIKIAFSLTGEWDKISEGSQLLTGVTVVRNDFLDEHEKEVTTFLEEHKRSTELTKSALSESAELVAEYGIIEKKEIAEVAMPECNIVCISGQEAKDALSGYLDVLFNADPKAVGGSVPSDDFYAFTLK